MHIKRTLVSVLAGLIPVLTPVLTEAADDVVLSHSLLSEKFQSYSNGLITSEQEYWNQTNNNHLWEMTSGSLFSQNGAGWSGNPDNCSDISRLGTPGCTHSNVFRLNSKVEVSGNIRISLDLMQNKDIHGSSSSWHGIHVWLRYQNQFNLYYASINRADGKIVIKRKVPCGNDNKGSYFALTSYIPHDWIAGIWQRYSITVKDLNDGSVQISVYDLEKSTSTPVAEGIDKGGNNPKWSNSCSTPGKYPSRSYLPLVKKGRVGLRGDFANFYFDNFLVESLSNANSTPISSSCPSWVPGKSYHVGDIVEYNGSRYIAVHDNPGYTPTVSTWYWDPVAKSCGSVTNSCENRWVSGQSYKVGDEVEYEGKIYIAVHDNPGFNPAVSTSYWDPTAKSCASVTNACENRWVSGQSYKVGDEVEYEGKAYIAVHDNPGFNPVVSTWYWDPAAKSCGSVTNSCENQWVSGQSYKVGDEVEHEGKNYIAIHDNPGYSPIVSTWYWDPVAKSCTNDY